MLARIVVKAKNKQKAREKCLNENFSFCDFEDYGKYRFETTIRCENKPTLPDRMYIIQIMENL